MALNIEDYFKDLSDEIKVKSQAVRRDFKNHSTSSGEKGEKMVFDFLISHLPKKFNLSLNSFVIDSERKFSSEIDILISDAINNSPYYSSGRREYWPVESVYAAIEVKTKLTSTELDKTLVNCQKFKKLNRKFCEGTNPKIKDSLFCIWAFDSDRQQQNGFSEALCKKLENIPTNERPDFIFVQNKFVICSGSYAAISKFGEGNSDHRKKLEVEQGSENLRKIIEDYKVTPYFGDKDPLIPFIFWIDSWLRRAGDRVSDPMNYIID